MAVTAPDKHVALNVKGIVALPLLAGLQPVMGQAVKLTIADAHQYSLTRFFPCQGGAATTNALPQLIV